MKNTTDDLRAVASSGLVCDGMEVEKCPRCKGRGLIWWRCQVGYNHEAFCPACDGKGNRRAIASRSHTDLRQARAAKGVDDTTD